MKRTLENGLMILVGIVMTVFALGADRGSQINTGFNRGWNAAMASTIQIGNDSSPCAVEISLKALSEMVNIGIMDWHAACLEAQS